MLCAACGTVLLSRTRFTRPRQAKTFFEAKTKNMKIFQGQDFSRPSRQNICLFNTRSLATAKKAMKCAYNIALSEGAKGISLCWTVWSWITSVTDERIDGQIDLSNLVEYLVGCSRVSCSSQAWRTSQGCSGCTCTLGEKKM